MNRRLARETAFKLIYETHIKNDPSGEVLDLFFDINPEVEKDEYIIKTVNNVFEHVDEIDKLISESLNKWSINRISKVTLAIMRLCVYEMLYIDELPYEISINEAIELVKKYDDGEKAGKFLNGVVNNIKEKLENK